MNENKDYEMTSKPCNYEFSRIEGDQEVWVCTECFNEIRKPHTHENEPQEYGTDVEIVETPCQNVSYEGEYHVNEPQEYSTSDEVEIVETPCQRGR